MIFGLIMACLLPEAENLTLIDELTVLAAVAEPPEVAPGESLELAATVVDPSDVGFDALVWFCTDLGEGCVEALPSLPLAAWTRVVRAPHWTFRSTFTVPAELGALVPEDTVITGVAWVLACQRGRCPIVDAVEADPAGGSEAWQRVVSWLADPVAVLGDTSFDEASVAYKRIALSNRPAGVRNSNPTVARISEGRLRAAPGGELIINLRFDDAIGVQAFGTGGAFQFDRYDASGGAVGMTWAAPDVVGTYRLYGVVDDGVGGTAVWRGEVRVE